MGEFLERDDGSKMPIGTHLRSDGAAMKVTCPVCGQVDVDVDEETGVVARHREPSGPYCRRSGIGYRSEEGWIVCVGYAGVPARIDDPNDPANEMNIAWFPDEAGARRWIEAHPKAKNPQAYELRSYEP